MDTSHQLFISFINDTPLDFLKNRITFCKVKRHLISEILLFYNDYMLTCLLIILIFLSK